jgi:hypothetical protein
MIGGIQFGSELTPLIQGFAPGNRIAYDLANSRFVSSRILSLRFKNSKDLSFDQEFLVDKIIELIDNNKFSSQELTSLETSIRNRLVKLEFQDSYCTSQDSNVSNLDIQIKLNEYHRCLKYLADKILLTFSKYGLLRVLIPQERNSTACPGMTLEILEGQHSANRMIIQILNGNYTASAWVIQEKTNPQIESFYIDDTEEIDFERLFYDLSDDGSKLFFYYVDSEYELEFDIFYITVDLTSSSAVQEIREGILTWQNNLALRLENFILICNDEFSSSLTAKEISIEDFQTDPDRVFIECTKKTPYTFDATIVYLDQLNALKKKPINIQDTEWATKKIEKIIQRRNHAREIIKIQTTYSAQLVNPNSKLQQQECLRGTENFLIELIHDNHSIIVWGEVRYDRTSAMTLIRSEGLSLENVILCIQKLGRLRLAAKYASKILPYHPQNDSLYYVCNTLPLVCKDLEKRCCIQPDDECRFYRVQFFNPSFPSQTLFSVRSEEMNDLEAILSTKFPLQDTLLSDAIALAYLQWEVREKYPDECRAYSRKGDLQKAFLYSPTFPLEKYDVEKVVIKFDEHGHLFVLYHIDIVTKTITSSKISLQGSTTIQDIDAFIQSVRSIKKIHYEQCKIAIQSEFQDNYQKREEYLQKPIQPKNSKTFRIVEESDAIETLSWTVCYTDLEKKIVRSTKTHGLGIDAVREKIHMIESFWMMQEFFELNAFLYLPETPSHLPHTLYFKQIDFTTDLISRLKSVGPDLLSVLVQPAADYAAFTFYFMHPLTRQEVCRITKTSLTDVNSIGKEILEYYHDLQKYVISKQTYERTGRIVSESLPETPSQYKLDTLLILFDTINFNNPEKQGYRNPYFLTINDQPATIHKLKMSLKYMVFRVQHQKEISGVPDSSLQRDIFYKKLHCLLTHLAEILSRKKDAELTAQVILELAEAGGECGGRWMSTAYHYFIELTCNDNGINEKDASLDEIFCKWLDLCKKKIIDEMLYHSNNSQNSHELLTICRTLKQAGIAIPGYWASEYEDPWAASGLQGSYKTQADILKAFKAGFSLHRIFETIYEQLNKAMKETPLLVASTAIYLLKSFATKHLINKHPNIKNQIDRIEEAYLSKKTELKSHRYFTPNTLSNLIESLFHDISAHVENEDELDLASLAAQGKVEEILSKHLMFLVDEWQTKIEKNDEDCKVHLRKLMEEGKDLRENFEERSQIVDQWESQNVLIAAEIKESLTSRVTQMENQIHQELARQRTGQISILLDQLLEAEGFFYFDEINDDGTVIGFPRRAISALLEELGFIQQSSLSSLLIPKNGYRPSRHRLY